MSLADVRDCRPNSAMAEYFLDLNSERTMEGLKAALARGRKGADHPGCSPEDIEATRALLGAGTIPMAEIARRMGVSRKSFLRLLSSGPRACRQCRHWRGWQLMPIRLQHRWPYSIDWQQLTDIQRFERAKGRCEQCSRAHGKIVCHLGDGLWWDEDGSAWRDGIVVREEFPMH